MAVGDKKPVVMESDIGQEGGVPPYLHASQHASGGADPITPSMIGAVAWDDLAYTNLGDILEWAAKQTNPTTIGVGPGIINLPFDGAYWTVELKFTCQGTWRTLIAWQAETNSHVKYERKCINGVWENKWFKIATTDYAVNKAGDIMTNALYIGAGAATGIGAKVGSSGSSAYLVATEDVTNAASTRRYIAVHNISNTPDIAYGAQLIEVMDDNTFKTATLLHTGNKPSGSYTGNGDATARTIDTGGIGMVIAIYCNSGFAIVTPLGAIVAIAGSSAPVLLSSSEATFYEGTLALTTTNSILNGANVTYYYQVL